METRLTLAWSCNMCANQAMGTRSPSPRCWSEHDRLYVMQVLQESATLVLGRQTAMTCSMVAVDPDSAAMSSRQTSQWDTVRGVEDPWGWDSSSCSRPGSTSACGTERQHRGRWHELVASVDQHVRELDASAQPSQQAAGSHAQRRKVWFVINSLSTLVVYYSISTVSKRSPLPCLCLKFCCATLVHIVPGWVDCTAVPCGAGSGVAAQAANVPRDQRHHRHRAHGAPFQRRQASSLLEQLRSLPSLDCRHLSPTGNASRPRSNRPRGKCCGGYISIIAAIRHSRWLSTHAVTIAGLHLGGSIGMLVDL